MADEHHEVEYQFTGDVASLQKATADAIKLLSQYQQKIDALKGAEKLQNKIQGASTLASKAAQVSPKLAAVVKVFQGVTTVVKGIGTAVKGVSTAVKSLGNAFSKVKSWANSAKSSIGGLTPEVDGLSKAFRTLTKVTAGISVGHVISKGIEKAISYIENLNLFTVAMGDSIDKALQFVNVMSEIYGMDPSNLYRYAGYFNQLTEAIGMTTEASKKISLSLTKASNDIASLFNVEIEQVVNNLASGMSGMSMAVRKYGIDIRKTTLAQTGLNYGFTENISTTSEANRQALRFLTIMNQVKNATKQVTGEVNGATQVMGDFARNIETPANQLRIFKEQIGELARAIGSFFLPILERTLYVINGIVMALKVLIQFLASLVGIDINKFGGEISAGASEASSAVSGIGDAADKSAKKLKKLIAPFDELTILTKPQDTSSSGAGGIGIGDDLLDPNLAKAIEEMSLGLDEIRMKALDVRDKILDLLGLEYDGSNIKVTVDGFIDDLIHLWDDADYVGFGDRIAEFLNQGVEWGITHTDPAQYAPILNEKIAVLADVLNGLVGGFNWEGLGTIIGNGITLALGMIDTFLTTFNWNQLGASLAAGLNGIIAAVNWDLLGKTIGDFFMAKVQALQGFFEKFNWKQLGTSLATGFMSLLNSIKWDEMGHMVTTKWNGIFDAILAFWDKYEWGTLGSKLAQYFSTIFRDLNWHNLGKAISDTLRGLLREIIVFVEQLDWFALGKGVAEAILAIDWFGLLVDVVEGVIAVLGAVVKFLLGLIVGIFTGIGKDIADGFKGGILDGLKNIGKWLKEHLVDPVVRAVKGFFGIHSPSTVFKEIGDNLISGLLSGITNALVGIATWIKTHITDPIINKVKSAFGIVGNVATVFKNIGTTVAQSLMNGLDTLKSTLTTWGTNISNTVQGILSSIGSKIDAIKAKLGDIKDNVITTVKDKASKIDWQGIPTVVTRKVTPVVNKVKTTANNVATAAVNKVKSATTTAKKTIQGVDWQRTQNKSTGNTSKKSNGSLLGNLGSKISGALDSIANTLFGNKNARKMAAGGVVTGPTHALIGEGRYDEAVIPLGNSPELAEMIDKIANAVSAVNKDSNRAQPPIEVRVYLDGTEITSHQNRTNRMYGRTQQNI